VETLTLRKSVTTNSRIPLRDAKGMPLEKFTNASGIKDTTIESDKRRERQRLEAENGRTGDKTT
jgi:hypothetical protein